MYVLIQGKDRVLVQEEHVLLVREEELFFEKHLSSCTTSSAKKHAYLVEEEHPLPGQETYVLLVQDDMCLLSVFSITLVISPSIIHGVT